MLSIMVMNDCVPIAVTVAKWSVNNTSRKLNTALSYFGNCYTSHTSRHHYAQLVERRANHDLEVDSEHVAETRVVIQRKHTEWDVIAFYE